MKVQEGTVGDIPCDRCFEPQVEKKRRPFGCPLSGQGKHEHKPGYVPFFPHGFAHGPENHEHWHGHGPNHHRCGPPEDGHRRPGWGWWGPPKRDSDGPSEHHFYGPPGFRPGHDRRPHDFYGPPWFRPGHEGRPHDFDGHGPSGHKFGAWWFGRRGPSDAERPRGPWGPWGGPDQPRF